MARLLVGVLTCASVAAPAGYQQGSVAFAGNAASSHKTTWVVEYIRDTGNPKAHLVGQVTNGTDGSETPVIALWSLKRSGAYPPTLIVGAGGYLAPQTNAGGSPVGCNALPLQPAPVCEAYTGGFTFLKFEVPPSLAAITRVLVVLVGDDRVVKAKLMPENVGWRMVTLKRKVTLLRARDVADLYASSASETVEHFTHAAAPGGDRGSLAIGALPCRTALGIVSAGHGQAKLSGGSQPKNAVCGAGGPVVVDAAAQRATTWRLAGDVWGTTTSASGTPASSLVVKSVTTSPQDVRLLVVDGPF
jgi:hypothetical protein